LSTGVALGIETGGGEAISTFFIVFILIEVALPFLESFSGLAGSATGG
jgi:hypothetical protein